MDALYNGNEIHQGDKSSKQEKMPCHSVGHNGNEIHQGDKSSKQENMPCHSVGHLECSERIQGLQQFLGPLLRVDTLEGSTWIKTNPKMQCQLVLPDNNPKIQKNEDNSSMCQMLTGNGQNEIHGHHNISSMVVETIMKSNRFYIASSLGLKIEKEGQDDFICYLKEDLVCYIEEVKDYGFNHIIIIGERDCGMLFLDCFSRVFVLNSMTNMLLFLGDYFKVVEKVTKGLKINWVEWIVDGTVVELKNYRSPNDYIHPIAKKEKKKHLKKKKSWNKKHH